MTRPLSKALNSLVGGVRAKRTLIIIRSVSQRYASLNLAEHWLASKRDIRFCATVTPQAGVISASRAPKALGVPEFAFSSIMVITLMPPSSPCYSGTTQ